MTEWAAVRQRRPMVLRGQGGRSVVAYPLLCGRPLGDGHSVCQGNVGILDGSLGGWEVYGPIGAVPANDGVWRPGSGSRRASAAGRASSYQPFRRRNVSPANVARPFARDRLPASVPYKAECPQCGGVSNVRDGSCL